ncbi:Rieske 2Fe-2S domain-containing protein [Vandammella animalimorsus]|uniref:Rieske (2Fe-2S) protein n=1 Tax=Vandammella animalimorsus TaxID=2029117 RepID=UPI0031BB4FAF
MSAGALPPQPLCSSQALAEGGPAVVFEVRYQGQQQQAFAVRVAGLPRAYLNRCTHVAMEMDYPRGQFLDDSGQWLICAHHGAAYDAATGACAGGPCQGPLTPIELSEQGGQVYWHPQGALEPVEF